MKKSILIFFVLCLFSPLFVFAATNPYPKTQTFNGEESVPCTRVVWQEVYERLGIALPGGWGNAVNWLKSAKNAGYEVGEEPRDNSIAVYSGFYGYGHVAYVLEVFDDYMQIIEGGVVGAEKQERTTSFEIGSGSGIYLTGFIYLDKVPSKSTSSTSNTTTKKDSNSFLKTLEILNISINFQKDVFTYTLTVPYETEKIKLNVEPEKKTSKAEWKEEYALDIGENTIRIKVTAEDKSSSTYILYITREEEKIAEEIKEEDNFVVEVEESKKDNRWLLWIPISLILLTILGLVLKKLIKRR